MIPRTATVFSVGVLALSIAGCTRTSHTSAAADDSIVLTPAVKPATPSDPVAARLDLRGSRLRPGATIELTLTLDIAPPYEIYDRRARPPATPTRLDLNLSPGVDPISDWSTPMTTPSRASDGHPAYAGQVTFTRSIRLDPNLAPGDYPLSCTLRYQACTPTHCLPPAEVRLQATLPVVAR